MSKCPNVKIPKCKNAKMSILMVSLVLQHFMLFWLFWLLDRLISSPIARHSIARCHRKTCHRRVHSFHRSYCLSDQSCRSRKNVQPHTAAHHRYRTLRDSKGAMYVYCMCMHMYVCMYTMCSHFENGCFHTRIFFGYTWLTGARGAHKWSKSDPKWL